MASSPKHDNEQAMYKVQNWLHELDDDASSSSSLSFSATSASNPPTPPSDLDTDDSESSEYANVPAVPENVEGAWEPVDATAHKSSLLFADPSSHLLWCTINDGKFYRSPTSHPRRVMDIGSGTCTWSMYFAMQNQGSHVVAKIREDLNLALPSEESMADLIFFRQLCGLTTADLYDFDIRDQIMLPLYEGLGFTLPEIELLAIGMREELAEDMEFESFSVYAQKPPQMTVVVTF
ncbi:uncharacterized protein BKA55DRAFT_717540 [Fusarium redolens]|uniref:Methyltransferase n=1 Tax=Fusarium redolens TaxID=48865 RepID=A0A9P9FXP9_FUSRE|nr:uncharacterized protein BKA55DRAFT_717540 [Fusarium redolens]KAH7220416.1 hypothetical protein BKA55DRAFT_717540 [Fusarium redolens]